MWLAFVLLPCNHLVPEETHKLLLNHATTRQQTDRAVGLWQHIYHPPVIADTNCTALSSPLSVTQSGQGSTWKRGFDSSQQWEFIVHPAFGPSCVQALYVSPKALHAPACATGSLHPTHGNKPLRAGGNHSKAQILGRIFPNYRNTRGHISSQSLSCLCMKRKLQMYRLCWYWWCWHSWEQGTGSEVLSFSGSITQASSSRNKPACSNRENFSQIFLPQNLYSLLSSVFLSRLTDTGMKSF